MSESNVVLKNYRGLNIRDDSSVIGDQELAGCLNFNLEPGGHLTKRYGFAQLQAGLGAANIQILGHFYTGTVSKLVVSTGAKVYTSSDGITWAELQVAAASIVGAAWAIQYGNNYYIIRTGSTIVQWDGTTATALAGSPSGDFALVHKDRLFVFNSQATGTGSSRFYFSDIANFASWPGSNFIDVRPGDGEPLVGGIVLRDVIIWFKITTTWMLHTDGLTTDWILREVNTSVGCTSKFTIKEIDGVIHFVSTRGVYITDGVTFKNISIPIEPIFRTRLITAATINLDSAAWWEDKYIVVVSNSTAQQTWNQWAAGTWNAKAGTFWGSSGVTYTYYVYHLKVGGWSQWDFTQSGIKPWTFAEIRTDAPTRGLYAGDIGLTGKTFLQDSTQYLDAGVTYNAEFTTKQYDFGKQDLIKRGKWLGIEFEGAAGTATMTYTADGSARPVVNLSPNVPQSSTKIAGPGFFRTVQFRLFTNVAGYFNFYGMNMHVNVKRNQIPLRV